MDLSTSCIYMYVSNKTLRIPLYVCVLRITISIYVCMCMCYKLHETSMARWHQTPCQDVSKRVVSADRIRWACHIHIHTEIPWPHPVDVKPTGQESIPALVHAWLIWWTSHEPRPTSWEFDKTPLKSSSSSSLKFLCVLFFHIVLVYNDRAKCIVIYGEMYCTRRSFNIFWQDELMWRADSL